MIYIYYFIHSSLKTAHGTKSSYGNSFSFRNHIFKVSVKSVPRRSWPSLVCTARIAEAIWFWRRQHIIVRRTLISTFLRWENHIIRGSTTSVTVFCKFWAFQRAEKCSGPIWSIDYSERALFFSINHVVFGGANLKVSVVALFKWHDLSIERASCARVTLCVCVCVWAREEVKYMYCVLVNKPSGISSAIAITTYIVPTEKSWK